MLRLKAKGNREQTRPNLKSPARFGISKRDMCLMVFFMPFFVFDGQNKPLNQPTNQQTHKTQRAQSPLGIGSAKPRMLRKRIVWFFGSGVEPFAGISRIVVIFWPSPAEREHMEQSSAPGPRKNHSIVGRSPSNTLFEDV